MARFLLVHGSCHGAWCWRDVVGLLADAGHVVRALDLPGHGQDRSRPEDVTLDHYAKAIVDQLDRPTVLVGHSMGGFPIARAAELACDMVEKLVFVCAYLPRHGMSLAAMRREAPRQPLLEAIRKSPDGQSFVFDPSQIEEKFYHDCPRGTLLYALPRLCPQPMRPQAEPIALGAAFDRVEKHYIVCSNDRAIPPEHQRAMCAHLPAGHCREMASSHSPFFSDPVTLAAHLTDIAGH